MRFSTSFLAVALPLLAQALPIRIRATTVVTPDDLLVFQFAHVLELLETDFYMQALAKFQPSDFLAAGFTTADVFAQQVESIAFDEMSHATALASSIVAFGAQPVTTCQFNFDSILTDVQTMATAARLIEHVGVGAYLGAAHLLSDPRFITTAASILTIEARHSSILNVFNGGIAIPQAFDIPLSPSEVLAIAGGFISGCDLGVPANPSLSITNTGPVGPGTALTFDSPALQGLDTSSLFCNMIVGGALDAISLPYDQCVVPMGINGPVAISILNDSQPLLASDIVDQSALTTVCGPALAFIDFGLPQQALSSSVLTSQSPLNKDVDGASSDSSGSSDDTSTISPGEASIIASDGSGATDSAGDPLPSATDSAGDLSPTDSAGDETAAPTAGLTPIGSSAGAASGPVVDAGDAETGPVTDVGAIAAAPAPTAAAASTDAAAPTDGADGAADIGSSPSDDSSDVGALGGPTDDSTDDSAAPTPAISILGGDDSSTTDSAAAASGTAGAPAQFNVGGTPASGGAIVVLGWDSDSPAATSS